MKIKKISILFLIVLILLLFTTVSKAAITVEFNGETVELPDLPLEVTSDMHYLICNNIYGWHIYYYQGTDFYKFEYDYSNITKDNAVYAVNINGELLPTSRIIDLKGNSWTSSKEWDRLGQGLSILAGNEYVYHADGTVFFRPAPVGKLGEILEPIPMKETVFPMIRLLPMILMMVVSYLGLRKALRLLSTLLRRFLVE